MFIITDMCIKQDEEHIQHAGEILKLLVRSYERESGAAKMDISVGTGIFFCPQLRKSSRNLYCRVRGMGKL